MGFTVYVVLTALVCLLLSSVTMCDKFVVFMTQSRSHVYPILPVITELEQYNHTVTLVLSSSMKDQLSAEGIEMSYILAKSLDKSKFIEKIGAFAEKRIAGGAGSSPFNLMYTVLKESNEFCHDFLADDELYEKLKGENFDYAIVDFAPVLCFEVLAYKLSLPFVFVGAHYDLILYRSPVNPSFMPAFFTPFTDKMTFWQRVVNSLIYVILLTRPSMPAFENLVERYAPDQKILTNYELKKSALLHITDGDILIDYALPLPPNIILCGGLAARPAKPLPDFIEHFVNKAVDGIVIVSFGSIIKSIPDELLQKFMTAFKNLKRIHFIIKYGTERRENGNVLSLPWLPQNDLLGHPKTKLLITHCGKSSVFEAIYHGIPIVGFPMGMDQPTNALLVEGKGYGIKMNIHEFSTEQLKTNINEVACSAHYKSNIQKASKIFHSRPQIPSKRAAYWIDLVTKYGPDHFRPSSMDMSWYSYYMVDVLSFYTIIVFVFIYLLRKCFQCCKITGKKQKVD